MEINFFQVDAFTDTVFKGNPAAVCISDEFPSDELMQSIAKENNLSVTAFVKPIPKNKYFIRCFTPTVELKVCGHGALASAFVLFGHVGDRTDRIVFNTPHKGKLVVVKDGDWFYLDFPVKNMVASPKSRKLISALKQKPLEMLKGESYYMVVFESEEQVRDLKPDFELLSTVEAQGIIVTAPGEGVDFVSRFFAPKAGIHEDYVTGTAHTKLVPYWAKKLGKDELVAEQLSQRRGILKCQLKGDRVIIGGQSRLYMSGTIML